jgi:serine/threonine protein kinase
VSACPSNTEKILDVVWDHCVGHELAFKFLRGPHRFFMRNAKQAARGYSGKLVTIYPRDVDQLEQVCKDLDAQLGGEPGPYILSDLRWGEGPVFVRYGGFEERRCRGSSGELVAAIEDDGGRLVPDERPPAFTVPSWVTLPDCLQPHFAARNAVSTGDLPYTIDTALLFSNGGGVYTGRDRRDGRSVVLKEARPHAGLTGDGADAVARLRREHDVLQRLAGIEGVPAVCDLMTVGDHLFLVMERLDGTPLNREVVRRHPGLGMVDDATEAAAYVRWAFDVVESVERLVAAIHERGIVHADLHPRNVLVADGRVGLVDYEVAHDVGSPGQQQLAAPGYGAPVGRTGAAVDEYALACLRFGMFAPLTHLFRFSPQKAEQLADLIAERFPVTRAWLDEAIAVVTSDAPALCSAPAWRAGEPGGWSSTRAELVEAIVTSATPARDDRLFPGDIAQFWTGGANMAHGAAGVLWALSAAGAGRFPPYEEWLLARVTQTVSEPQLGFYDGYHGIAYALDHLGHRDAALDLVEMCLTEPSDRCGHDLRSGLAGIGLNLLHLAGTTGESLLRASAVHTAQVLADRLDRFDDTSTISGGGHPHAGLMRGWTGPGLLFLHLFEATGDTTFLDRAAAALRADLQRCTRQDDGTVQVNEGWRTMPYLDVGSVGIGLVLDRYLAHRPDQQFAEASAAIHGAACSWFYIEPGLFSGRAGMVYYLATRRHAVTVAPEPLRQQVAGLAWHALGVGEGIAFPGEHLLRLSMDLASGTAGVLVALAAAHDERPVHLPFLAPAPSCP